MKQPLVIITKRFINLLRGQLLLVVQYGECCRDNACRRADVAGIGPAAHRRCLQRFVPLFCGSKDNTLAEFIRLHITAEYSRRGSPGIPASPVSARPYSRPAPILVRRRSTRTMPPASAASSGQNSERSDCEHSKTSN